MQWVCVYLHSDNKIYQIRPAAGCVPDALLALVKQMGKIKKVIDHRKYIVFLTDHHNAEPISCYYQFILSSIRKTFDFL